ncbi:hypothetical protein ABH15_00650 [Methanoculleus taiwanensis]|uniref:Uncharacterized protein n=1 Tax=Methanoculleus taiwanensis TaxID=1550565 RepID=A0A498H392_9EURY|nr:hypothetical protein [Methanoculleus taiwanensis]RXE56725.1 hypothetical protein ABH15_00650 [Methanoculleus taiwanensis]
MTAYGRYQTMIINALARKLGPAATDFAKTSAKRANMRFEDLTPETVEGFAARVEENLTRYVPTGEAQFVANTIRKLRA